MRIYILSVFLFFLTLPLSTFAATDMASIERLIAEHAPRSGLYVLEKGEESLLGRAWLVDNAQETIDVQYFIWSVDNIGILAAEALLRAAERGVRVRVLVDDLLMDAPPESLIALAAHPDIQIRIYNPVHKTGVSLPLRIYHLLSDFRNANQRMHDKTLIVDGQLVITGGRNMADEYYDYDHHYNFRDRDLLVVGGVASDVQEHFERFWESELARPVEALLPFAKLLSDDERIAQVRAELHAYAADPTNFAPPVRSALAELDAKIPLVMRDLEWGAARFFYDLPGKNSGEQGLAGGGASTRALVEVVSAAKHKLVIQSPYLVLPQGALALFRELVGRGVEVKISTNSLASTDNLAAFSGYKKQRAEIVAAGVQVFEFKPNPAIQPQLLARYPELAKNAPVFAIHAKTMVVDGQQLFIGTFNLDQRSANLNTEVGVLIDSVKLAQAVEASIELDMRPENSWWTDSDEADRHAEFSKRFRLWGWQLLSLDALL